MQVDTKYNLI